MTSLNALGPALLAQEMRRENFWRERFPELSIGDYFRSKKPAPPDLKPDAYARIEARMREDGYFQEKDGMLDVIAPRLAKMVKRCVDLGIPPPFLFLFDEAWACFYRLHPALARLLGEGYRLLPDFWVWHVDPAKEEFGWRPHRDKGMKSLGVDGKPLSLTVWVALSEATPLNGCIYVLPASRDPHYNTPKENEWQINLASIRALPAKPGEWLCWNQALLHWGSQASPFASQARISMALEFQRGDAPAFNAPLLAPFANPDFGLRLRLVAKQILQYQHMYALHPALRAVAETLLAE